MISHTAHPGDATARTDRPGIHGRLTRAMTWLASLRDSAPFVAVQPGLDAWNDFVEREVFEQRPRRYW